MNKKEKEDLAFHISEMKNSDNEDMILRAELMLRSFPSLDTVMVKYDTHNNNTALADALSGSMADYNAFVTCSETYDKIRLRLIGELSHDELIEIVSDYVTDNDIDCVELTNIINGHNRVAANVAIKSMVSSWQWRDLLTDHVNENSTAYKYYTGGYLLENDPQSK